MQVISLIRVSTDDQRIGPEAQRDAIAEWCERNGATVAAEFSEVVSGGADLDQRTGLLAAVAAVAEHGADALVVAKRDRLARDPLVTMTVERDLARIGARIVSADGVGNGDDPMQRFIAHIEDGLAALERARIRARTRAALAAKKARGERTGGVPYGYTLADDGVHLVELPDEQAVIAIARKCAAAGFEPSMIARGLHRRGMLSRTGRKFTSTQVRRMLAR